MATALGLMAGHGGDPRLHSDPSDTSYIKPQHRSPHDHTVSFEEYIYHAKLARAEEDTLAKNDVKEKTTFKSLILPSKNTKGDVVHSTQVHLNNDEKSSPSNGGVDKRIRDVEPVDRHTISDDEWKNASRAVRTASWSAVFYLITTDILGPFGVPFAMGTLGWGPGIALYTVFGGLAIYSGFLLYWMFLGLDSHSFPLKSYGDIAFRVYELLCNVGAIIISNGQALSQISRFKLCYAICCLVFALSGFLIGQVRTLQKYGWLANAAIWMNVFIIICTMGVVAHSSPNYAASASASSGAALGGLSVTPDEISGAYPPITHSVGLPYDSRGFVGSVNGLMQAVYAYGGAMVFVEFMSEMRRPRDFWKGMICAQVFIYIVYVFYGCFIYAFQGQYSVNPSYQGVAPYAWQTVGNVVSFISALIAAGLYGNIGVKVLYNNLFIDFFHAPPLTSKKGKMLWVAIIPVYWSLAFIVAAAIPNFFGFTGLVAAVCILQFTYTFPPLLYLGFSVKRGAELPGEGFDAATGRVVRLDGGVRRWIRGFLKGRWWLNVWHVVFFMGSLATAGLGSYSAIEALIDAFKNPQTTAFTCHSPLDG
ncbi:related to neutral amino acid permease [Rhynchosporium graminicola]|uniref:Related to neutral amino acid permease n=1 Tax=Rhynchosporium graminicola TaxID=2792576 RepID=A0A1E1JSK0_9HELO|nr:related to neutral amino acid permease [Rhynchosporium commune]